MKLTSTNILLRRPFQPRGTAELETALVIPILLMILFLIVGALWLGRGRMSNVYNAENGAYTQVVSGLDLTPAFDPVPIDGITVVRPTLPNRFDIANPVQTLRLDLRWQSAVSHLDDKAVFLDPAWTYTSWPNVIDQPPIQAWFADYVGESHPSELVYSLGLQPASPH